MFGRDVWCASSARRRSVQEAKANIGQRNRSSVVIGIVIVIVMEGSFVMVVHEHACSQS